MSFGGAVSAMMTTLKNNKRPRVSAFKKLEGYEGIKYKKGTIDKKATPQQLREIRETLQKENRSNLIITIVLLVTFFSVLFILFNYVTF